MRVLLRLAAAVFSALVSLECLAIESSVPAISAPDRVSQIDLAPGRYCVAEIETDGGGDVSSVALGSCVSARVEGGWLDLAAEGAPFVRTVFSVARLTRGTALLESREADGSYRLHVAIIREGGLAILPAPGLTSRTLAAAEDVELDLTPGASERLDADRPLEPFAVRSGAPDAVLGFLRSVVGLWFDRALRDRELGGMLFADAIYLVQVDTPARGAEREAPASVIATLRGAIGRAMALE